MFVSIFIRPISAYFYTLLGIWIPCHGSLPLSKYSIKYPKDYKSSRRHCSYPRCEAILAYLAVPTRDFPPLISMCFPVLLSLYLFAKPKSITYTVLIFSRLPIMKLLALMSLWTNPLRWICYKRVMIWIPMLIVAARLSFFSLSDDEYVPELEKVFQGVGKQVNDHKQAIIFDAIIVESADSGWIITDLLMPWKTWYNLIS